MVRHVERFDWFPEPRPLRPLQLEGLVSHASPSPADEIRLVIPPIPMWSVDDPVEVGTAAEYREIADLVLAVLRAAVVSHCTGCQLRVSARPSMVRLPCLVPGPRAPSASRLGNVPHVAASYLDKDEALAMLREYLMMVECDDEAVDADVVWVTDMLGEYFKLETDLAQCSLLTSMIVSISL